MSTSSYQQSILLIVVYIALFEDAMLTTSIDPIVPDYLFSLWHPNFTASTLEGLINATQPQNETDLLAAIEHQRQRALGRENVAVSLLFAVKSLVQIFANIFVGMECDRIGYTAPLFTGFVVSCLSSLMFAFNRSYTEMFVARAIQGIGSSCASTAGLGMLAAAHTDDAARGTAVSRAMGGIGLGVMLGQPFGGALYELGGIQLPYLILAALAFLCGVVQLVFLPPHIVKGSADRRYSSAKKPDHLLRDPCILTVIGSLILVNAAIALVEPALPIYMMQRWRTSAVLQGAIFLPVSAFYLFCTQMAGPVANRLGRCPVTIVGHGLAGLALVFIPLMPSALWLVAPMSLLGMALAIFSGMTSACNFAELPRLVDQRHTPKCYGSVYALADTAICVAFFAGPFMSGPLIAAVNFQTVLALSAAVIVLYAPLLQVNRNVKGADDFNRLCSTRSSKNLILSYQSIDAWQEL